MGKRSKKPSKPGSSSAFKGAKVKSASGAESSKYTVEDLLSKIDDLIEQFEFDTAQKFCERALQLDPNHPQLLEATATVFLELGNPDAAYEALCRAVDVSPDVGHVKYMYLGQMCPGKEGAEHYVKGLAIMEQTLETQKLNATSVSSGTVSVEDVCTGYCSLAELYLTDLCFEEDAQVRCGEYLSKALQLSPDNAEALQLMASYRLSEGKMAVAKELIVKSVDAWLQSDDQDGQAQAAAAAADSSEKNTPPYPTRMGAAKILIEVGEHQRAFTVLEGLIDDDDEVIQVWYLFGWAHYNCNELSDARSYLLKAKELTAKLECDDVDMIAHVDELLAELGPETDDEADDNETATAADEDMETS